MLDCGTGSNFLAAGTGRDAFFSHAGGGAVTWTTAVGFKPGGEITFWGVAPSVSGVRRETDQGAAGYTGATAHVSDGQGHTASLTQAGRGAAEAGALTASLGSSGGHDYLLVA